MLRTTRPAWAKDYMELIWSCWGRDFPTDRAIPMKGNARVDCWGFIMAIQLREYGRSIPSFDEYQDMEVNAFGEFTATSRWSFHKVDAKEIQAGDIIMMKGSAVGIHAGVILNRREFIHLEQSRDARIDKLDDPWWGSRVLAFWRAKEVETAQ